jgi:AcrR family transcriptional regulator
MPRGQFDRSERRARTRALLLEAAARVYARRGFDSATLDEVAEEAGFTKGAVYDHFGSKENLLLALLDEFLSTQIAEQIALFDPQLDTWERPRGADRFIEDLHRDPDPFRLFVELWVHAQRDDRLRERLANGIDALRATFRRFGAEAHAAAGFEHPDGAVDQFANVIIALGTGLGMIKLVDPENVPDGLLGGVLSLLIGALESSAEARAAMTGGDHAEKRSPRSTANSVRFRSTPPV